MAWNDPPSSDYQQISNPTRKFKHRYVSVSNLGQYSTQSQYENQPIHQHHTATNSAKQQPISNAQNYNQLNYTQSFDYQHNQPNQFISSSNNSQNYISRS